MQEIVAYRLIIAHALRNLIVLCLLATLMACSLTGEFRNAEQQKLLSKPYHQNVSTIPVTSTSHGLTMWWEQFDNSQINHLVEQALKNNYDLKLAAANVLESQALLDSAFAGFWPALSLNYSPQRNFISTSTRFTGNGGGGFVNNSTSGVFSSRHAVALSFSWQLDLFGRLRHAYSAAKADLAALEKDRDAVTNSLIANVLRQYVEMVISNQRLHVANQIVDSRKLTLKTVDRRYRRGVSGASAVDVRLARENMISAQANQTALALTVELASHGMDTLLGQAAVRRRVSEFRLSELPALQEKIIGIPIELLDHRPDLKAAEFRSIASNERIGVALADLYPDLTLTGRLGTNTNSLSQFFSLDNLIASVAGELATTLFQGGRLRAEVAAAEARLQAQAARYSQVVLTAVREVEDALASHRLLGQRLGQIEHQLMEAKQAEKLAKQRYGRGIDSLLVVLETERRRQAAEDLLLQVKQQRWNSRINLHLAIGGNWLPVHDHTLSIAQQ